MNLRALGQIGRTKTGAHRPGCWPGPKMLGSNPETSMTSWKITIFNRRYVFKWLVFGVYTHLIEGMINHHYHLASSWWLQSSREMSNISQIGSFSKIGLNRGTILKHFETVTYSKGLSKKQLIPH